MLTVTQLRRFVPTALEDADLQGLLNAAYQAIDPRLPSGPQTELLTVGADVLVLSLPATSISSIVDRSIELEADDYEVISPTMLRRLTTGTNPTRLWYRPLVTYVAAAADAERDRMAIDLVKLELNFQPGLTSRRIGEYSETFGVASAAGGTDYASAREAILSSYGQGGGAFV